MKQDAVTNSKLLDDFETLLESGECVAYLGSGLSSVSFPEWNQLVKELCEKCGVEFNSNVSLPDAAEEALQEDESGYYEHLGQVFDDVGGINPMYDILLKLPFKCYITANFDVQLAHEVGRTDPDRYRLMVYPDLNLEKSEDAVYHIHGLIEEGVTPIRGQIVLARSEFDRAYGKCGPSKTFLIEMFKRNPICFIGCKLEEDPLDDVFKNCIEQQDDILQFGGGSLPGRFAFLPELAEEDRYSLREIRGTTVKEQVISEDNRWSERDIQVIRYDPITKHHRGLRTMFARFNSLKAQPILWSLKKEEVLDGR